MKKKNTLTKTLFKTALVASVPATYYASGTMIFNKMCKVNQAYKSNDILEMIDDENIKAVYRKELPEYIEWFKSSKVTKHQITSFDGLLLDGIVIANHEREKRHIIMLHGHNGDRYTLLKQAHEFDLMGYNLIMIDLRSFGKSEGQYTTMGFKESLDLLSWMQYFDNLEEEYEFGLYGVGIGANAILKVLSYNNSSDIKFAIVDSAYTSLLGVMEYNLKNKLLNPSISANFKRVLGFDIKECNVLDGLKQSTTPLMIMHGLKDSEVPYFMAEAIFENSTNKVELQLFDNGKHNLNCYEENYFNYIFDFLNELD